MESGLSVPYYPERHKNQLSPTPMKASLTILIAGIILTMASCKHEDCGAYQGSGKGTRSFKQKKHHRHAMVVRFDAARIA